MSYTLLKIRCQKVDIKRLVNKVPYKIAALTPSKNRQQKHTVLIGSPKKERTKKFTKTPPKTAFAEKQCLKSRRKNALKNASDNSVMNFYRCKNVSKYSFKKYHTKKLPETPSKSGYRKMTELENLSKTIVQRSCLC